MQRAVYVLSVHGSCVNPVCLLPRIILRHIRLSCISIRDALSGGGSSQAGSVSDRCTSLVVLSGSAIPNDVEINGSGIDTRIDRAVSPAAGL